MRLSVRVLRMVVVMGVLACGVLLALASILPEDGSTATFTNGGLTMEAKTVTSGDSKVTTITHDGEEILQVEVTATTVRKVFPTHDGAEEIDTLARTLDELPSDFATNRLAAFIAGTALLGADGQLRPDSPGCDWFPDTRCTLQCCYDHDVCYADNNCGASSWIPLVGSEACKICNGVAQMCILEGCAYGLEGDPSRDECFDARCREHYTCANPDDDCECEHDCDPPSTCGNGSCNVGETEQNCASDCAGGGVNICCRTTDNCPSETPSSCPGSCCCCGMGEVCGGGNLCTPG